MLILGVDPGRKTGWAILEITNKIEYVESGVIIASPKKDYNEAIGTITKSILCLVRQANIIAMAIESGFIGKGVSNAMKIGEMRGAIKTVALLENIDVCEFTPREVKKIATGSGKAEKSTVASFVGLQLGIDCNNKSDDETDAIAIAFAYCQACIRESKSG